MTDWLEQWSPPSMQYLIMKMKIKELPILKTAII